MWSLPGYTFEGIFKEITKYFGSSTETYIMAARTAQGYGDLESLTEEERVQIIEKWKSMHDKIRKAQQTLAEETRETVAEYRVKRHQTLDQLKRNHKRKKEQRLAEREVKKQSPHSSSHRNMGRSFHPLHHSHSFPGSPSADAKPSGFDEAVQRSVQATSEGDAEQDMLVERAIRASIEELKKAQEAQINDHDAFNRAIEASIAEMRNAEAGRPPTTRPTTTTASSTLMTDTPLVAYDDDDDDNDDDDDDYDDDDYNEALREALKRSLQDFSFLPSTYQDDSESYYSAAETDGDAFKPDTNEAEENATNDREAAKVDDVVKVADEDDDRRNKGIAAASIASIAQGPLEEQGSREEGERLSQKPSSKMSLSLEANGSIDRHDKGTTATGTTSTAQVPPRMQGLPEDKYEEGGSPAAEPIQQNVSIQ